jgi:flagellar basal-body rod protein FlgB
MAIDLGGVTVQAVRVALDAAVLRHVAIANNIANAKSPGYQPMRVSFEDQLQRAGQLTGAGDEAALRAQLERLSGDIRSGTALRPADDGPVQLDREMVHLADNSLRYRAMLQALGSRSAILKLAINSQGV